VTPTDVRSDLGARVREWSITVISLRASPLGHRVLEESKANRWGKGGCMVLFLHLGVDVLSL